VNFKRLFYRGITILGIIFILAGLLGALGALRSPPADGNVTTLPTVAPDYTLLLTVVLVFLGIVQVYIGAIQVRAMSTLKTEKLKPRLHPSLN